MSAEAKNSPNVKRMEVRRYPFVVPGENGEGLEALEEKSFLLRKVEYHSSGSILLDTEFDEDGNEVEKFENKLDEQGRVTEHSHYVGGELSERITITYNEAGKILEETRHYEEGDPSPTLYKYNEENHLLEKRVESSPGEAEQIERYEYHPEWKDKTVRYERYGEDERLLNVTTYVYELRDEKPVLKESHIENKETGKKFRTEHYDARTHEDNVALVAYDSDNRVAEIIREWYDEKGNVTKTVQKSRNPASDPAFEFEYDERSNVIRQTQLIGGNRWAEVKRKYDEQNLQAWQATDHSNLGYYTDVFTYEVY